MRFDSYHPAINFLYFSVMLTCCFLFDHPAFLCIGWMCALIYSIALEGKRAALADALLLLLTVAYALYYACYNHFGVTDLRVNFIGNHITLESVLFGAVRGVKLSTALMWMICVHAVISSDKVIYLLGRVSPKLSLFLSILLRMAPRVRERGHKVEAARQSVGRGIRQGNLFRRIKSALQELSIVITWTLEDFVGSSDSMRARGYSLKGRTAFSIYRFDNRDRSFVVALFALFTVLSMAVLLDQTRAVYAPVIQLNPVMPLSFFFYGAYALAALLPLLLQLIGEARFRRLISRMEESEQNSTNQGF